MRMENLILRKHYGLHSLEPCYQQEGSILNGASTKSSIKLPYFITCFDVARNRSTDGQNISQFYPL